MVPLGKSSAECLRRFRSLSPVFQSAEESLPVQEQSAADLARYRSHSYPSSNLFKKDILDNSKTKRSLSTERERGNFENIVEYHERDRYGIEDSIKHIKSQVSNMHRGRQILRTNRQKPHKVDKTQFAAYITENPTIARKVKAKAVTELGNLNKEPVVHKSNLGEYHLKDSKPVPKENVFDVFDYYSEQHRWKDTKVLPHLQPHNLKPYGTGENLVFPVYNINRKREIIYPEYTEMSDPYKRKNESSIKSQTFPAPSPSLHREFCTTPRTSEQGAHCKALVPENKLEQTNLILQKDEQCGNNLETANSQIKSNSQIPVVSKDLEKCNQVISEYKKLNPNYTSNKKEFKSGSVEEKEAVNNAVNFATNFKKYFFNNIKVENPDKILSLKNKTVSDIQVREHHEGGIEAKKLPLPAEEIAKDSGVPSINSLLQCSSQPAIERKKYSFSGATLAFPEVPVTPVRVRVGPKANLLQSSAPPEATKCWDEIRLEKNERLVSPWPSYADQIKGLFPQKDANRIKYPSQGNNLKTIKNTTNLQIQQSANNQPKMELNSRSLHKNIKIVEADDATISKAKDTQTDESFQKRLFHYCKNKIKSLPDLRRFSTTRKGNGNEETVAQKRFQFNKEGNPICDSTEFDTPPKTTEYFDKQDCFCVEPKLPTYAPPLKRLRKVRIEEPPKICPVENECEPTKRADHGLTIKFKKLPEIIPIKDCKPPCVELKEGWPLPRLKKRRIEEPFKICPYVEKECYCPPRADAGLKIKRKCLPKLVPKVCPNPEIEMKDCPPLKPLKKVNMPEPVKVCPYVEPESFCPPRADENLVVRKKKLPQLKPPACPRVSQEPPENIPLRRLDKIAITPPEKCHIVEEYPTVEEFPPRADEGMKIRQRKLQPHIPSDKCQPCGLKLKPGYPLRRLEKIKVKEPPRICPLAKEEEVYECPPRADDSLKVKIKHLPILEAMPCPYIEHRGISDVAPLKPLRKVKIKEPEKHQPDYIPEEPCTPRADEGMVVKRKTLPQLEVSDCPNIPNVPTEDVCPLRPLKKVRIAEPIRHVPECLPEEESYPARADKGLVMRKRTLPKLRASDCPCIEEKIPENVPLKRLKKSEIKEPPRICIEEDPCNDPSRARSDDICGYTVKSKTLPPMLLKAENNRISTRSYAKKMKGKEKSPTVNVSHKRKFSLYSKMHESWRTRRILSVISFNIKIVKPYSKKSDPYDEKYTHENPACCCIEDEFPQTDITPKLKRLPKFKKEDKDWSKLDKCIPACRNPRADDNLKPKKKHLPRLRPSKCPCKESRSFKNPINPNLKRLPKFKKDDIDWAKMKQCLLPCRNPRADDNWKSKKRGLPKLKPKRCPCTEYATLVDVAPLKRLPKFEKPDIDWETRKQCLPPCRNIRADASLKKKKKCLPRLKISKCPCVEANYVPTSQPPLKRLWKFEKPDIDWNAQLECQKPCRNPRADDNWKIKKKTLPKIKGNNCPCINLGSAKFDVPPLKRLPKFPKPDINWKDFLICVSPCRTPRADDNLKPRSKSLPLLKSSKCPCVEVDEVPSYLPTVKRLPKFEKPDKDWLQFKICQSPCRNPRADDNWKLKKKPLPKLKASDCPCIKIDNPKYDVEPLRRLPKFKKEDINWKIILKCIKPCSLNARADDNLKVRAKRLPLLKVNKCPCVEHPEIPTYDPQMKRLPKFRKPDIDWAALLACQKPCRNPRSDDNWKMPKKRLPKIKSSNCPCINLGGMVDVAPLRRLPKFKKEDKDWASFDICRIPCRTPRADAKLKVKEKRLPLLRPSKCPCIEHPKAPEFEPQLKRLRKFKKPDVDWESLLRCQKPCGKMPRADDNWRMPKRRLPKIKISKCPCVEPREIVDVEPLKRLPKFKKEDKDWKSLEACKPWCRNARADDNLKVKSKSLPLLRPSKCPCIDEEVPCEFSPELKRLTKLKDDEDKGDIIWENVSKCMPPCRNERADDLLGYKVKKKKLPPLIQRKCYHTTQRRPSYPTRRSLMTSPLKLQRKKDERERAKAKLANSGVKSEKECQKIKRECPEMSLKGCPPPDKSAKEGCLRDYNFVKCTKQKTPYPSFSECGVLYEAPSCECLMDYKILQPKYPIIEKLKLLKPPPPDHSHIDGRKERDCLMKRMGKRYQGMTKTCETFNCPDNKMVGMSRLRKQQRERKEDEENSSALVCAKEAAEASERSKNQTEEKGLWERICDFFKPRPNCPKPGEWKQKKLVEDAEKAAKAAGMTLCKPENCKPKVADPCRNLYAKRNKSGKSNPEDCQTKVADPCRNLYAKRKKRGKSGKTNPCKNPFPRSKKKSSKRNKCKDPFPRKNESHDPCKPKKKPKKAWERRIVKEDGSDDCRTKRAKSMKKCKRPTKTGASKVKRRCKPTKFKKIKSQPSTSCKPKQKKKKGKKFKCNKAPKASEKKCEHRNDGSKECEEDVDYSTLLPPEIPICSPRHQRVQIRPKEEIKTKCTPMDDCFRKIKGSKDMHTFIARSAETQSWSSQKVVCRKYTFKGCTLKAKKDNTKACKIRSSPYPSFSECRPPFPKLKEYESFVAKNKAETVLTKLELNLSKGSQLRDFAKKTTKKYHTTISRVKRAFAFHPPVEWRRTYSSDAKYNKLLNSLNKSKTRQETSKDALNRRLLAGIEEGIQRLESQDLDVPNNPYYQILKALQKLSEKEVFDFFDQESQFNPFEPLKSDTRDTVSYVCQMNPKKNNPYFLDSDICFEPRSVGISDVNAQLEELQIVEAFRRFCTKICEESEEMEIPYEEKERIKTEDMKRELDQLLKRTRNE